MCSSLRTQADHEDACWKKPHVFTLKHSRALLSSTRVNVTTWMACACLFMLFLSFLPSMYLKWWSAFFYLRLLEFLSHPPFLHDVIKARNQSALALGEDASVLRLPRTPVLDVTDHSSIFVCALMWNRRAAESRRSTVPQSLRFNIVVEKSDE